jgi:hypothetical protein
MRSLEIEDKILRLLMRKIAYYSTRFFLFIIGMPIHGGGTPLRIWGRGKGNRHY